MRWRCVWMFVGLFGCETQVWEFDAGAEQSTSGGQRDPQPICEGDACTCEEGRLACDERCVDPRESTEHCGACGNACAEGERCAEAKCECAANTTRCGPLCVNLLTHLLHCGQCNLACTGNQQCQAGICQ